MINTLQALPMSFWVATALLALGSWWAVGQLRTGVGIPTLAVLGTVAAWYVGDALYNDYADYHAQTFELGALNAAWWQVSLFIGAFLLLIPPVNQRINAPLLRLPSQIHLIIQTGRVPAQFETRLQQLLVGTVWVFLLLGLIAAFRLGAETQHYFLPMLGYRADPWGRGQIGGGISALLSLASYLQIFSAAMFGVVAALAKNRWVRVGALIGCLVSWPYFLFDRTRNIMLAIAVPGILAWVFLRLRLGMALKLAILGACFLTISAWFKFVIENRTDTTVVAALEEKDFSVKNTSSQKHEGLNMFEELCWINTFLRNGTYQPNWGQRYFAEIVNPVPRVLWPGKPMIALDYAIARGQQYTDDGTTATVATGMIGQGVVNFGRYLGPAFAAFLMSIWVALLARLDLHGEAVGRLPLYCVGLVLTFNLGRDITFITLYTFAFGWVIVWWLGRREAGRERQVASQHPVRTRQKTRYRRS